MANKLQGLDNVNKRVVLQIFSGKNILVLIIMIMRNRNKINKSYTQVNSKFITYSKIVYYLLVITNYY